MILPRLLLVLTLFAPAAPLRAADPALPAWAARPADGSAVRLVIPAPENPRFAHLGWPKAVRARDGTIVLAYLAGPNHGGPGGSPAVSLSRDDGRTFSPMQVLREFGAGQDYRHSGNLALGLADDGALVVLAMAFSGNTTNHIFGWRSSDAGRTWSATDTSALGPDKTGSVFGDIVRLPDGRLLAAGHYRPGAKPHQRGIWISYSSDRGRSWDEPRLIGDIIANEPALTFAGGRLIGLIRSDDTALRWRYWLARSDDLGANWKIDASTVAVTTRESQRLAAPFIAPDPSAPNRVLALTNERNLPGQTPGCVWLWRADTATLEWKKERKLLEFPAVKGSRNVDFGYPWLLHLAGKRWLMFYYHGETNGPCPLWSAEVEIRNSL
jgi:hypothetical protein